MASHPAQLTKLQGYLEQERQADFRSEYFSGEIFAMSGGTGRHSELSARMIVLLSGGACRVFDSNLKIYIESVNRCVYPDASVVCGTPEYLDPHHDVLLNPTLVVEVLSPSTERYDKGSKALYYRNLPSLSHCLLVSQDRVFIEHSVYRKEQNWAVQTYTDLTDTIHVERLGLELPLEDIYKRIV